MINTTCDYCFREFAYAPDKPPICMNCGLENVRTTVGKPRMHVQMETAMLVPSAERAVMPDSLPRMPGRKRKKRL